MQWAFIGRCPLDAVIDGAFSDCALGPEDQQVTEPATPTMKCHVEIPWTLAGIPAKLSRKSYSVPYLFCEQLMKLHETQLLETWWL